MSQTTVSPEREEGELPPAEPVETFPAEETVRRIRRLELASGVLLAGTLAILEMGPALVKKGFHGSDLEVALLTSGQSLGLILSFFTAHLATRHPPVPLVFGLYLIANLALCPVFFLRPTFAMGFVALHFLARVCWSMSIPARVVVYRANFPTAVRGSILGKIRQLQLFLTTAFALILSVLLDWNVGQEDLVAFLGECPLPAEQMVRYVIPSVAVFGLAGSFVYRRIREFPAPDGGSLRPGGALDTVRECARVLREDREFRRYEGFFFLFGFANVMMIPLTQIHAVDELHATWFDLAMINVIIVQGIMALTMSWWGKRLDRHSPLALRGALNLILSADLLILALAPAIGWVYVGRVFRGLALGGGTLLWMLGSLHFARSSRNAPIYTGIHTVFAGLRWSAAPFAAVWLKSCFEDRSRPIFLMCFAILVVTGIGMLRGGRRR